ncbi:MAG TPA: hypothetical protein VLW84_13565 [Terriglobales bacterium]|nr:hypothetical protein [Terriglobales bacterium]
MSKVYLSIVLLSLVACAACGSSSSSSGSGPFSNASLTGQYVYQISGTDLTTGNPYSESGVFAANGGGTLTSGIDDLIEAGAPISTNNTTGVYTINPDGTGAISLNIGTTTLTFAVTMATNSEVYMIESDAGLNSGGVAQLQDTAAIGAAPSGTFTFRTHIVSGTTIFTPVATVGAMTIGGGAISSGSEDSLTLGLTSVSLTLNTNSTFSAPDANGRGTFTLNDSSGKTTNFAYYIISGSKFNLFASSLGLTGQGSAELQNGSLTLSGSYAFGSQGDTTTNGFGLGGVNTVGRFDSDGTSAISNGALDTVQGGNSVVNKTFTGNFTISSGRAVVTLSTSAQGLFWMVSPTRAFFMFNDQNKVEDGTVDQQVGSGFSNSTMNGQFAFLMGGFDTTVVTGPPNINRVGTLKWDGSGHLTLNEAVNSGGQGAVSPGILTGSYTVATNGRASGTINGLSESNNDLVFYLVSGSNAYVIQNDAGVEINGTIAKQPQ